jgi:hypothetical protein
MSSCDPTWEVCDTAVAADPAPVETTTEVEDDSTAGPSKVPLLYGVGLIYMIAEGYIANNSFNSWVTDVIAAKVANNTAWTETYVKAGTPFSTWKTQTSVQQSMYAGQLFWFVLNQAIGRNGGLVNMLAWRFSQIGVFIPLINIFNIYNAESKYVACSTLGATNFDSTTTTVTQYVSCTSGTTALFGDTGTSAAKINNDPHSTWALTGYISSVVMLVLQVFGQKKIGDNYKYNKNCYDDEGAVIDCPTDDSAAADDSADAAAADSTADSSSDWNSGSQEDVWW